MVPGDNIDGRTNFGGGEVDLDIRPRLKEIFRFPIPHLAATSMTDPSILCLSKKASVVLHFFPP